MFNRRHFVIFIRVAFVSVQVLATFFIYDAYTDWEMSPAVTSVEFRNVEKELFPAVTVCYPHSWKWPGIINLLDKWNRNKSHWDFDIDNFSGHTWSLSGEDTEELYQNIFLDVVAEQRSTAIEYEYFEGEDVDSITYDFCRQISELFKTPTEQKQGRFIINMLAQLNSGNIEETKKLAGYLDFVISYQKEEHCILKKSKIRSVN